MEAHSELIEAADALHRRVSRSQRELLRVIAQLDLAEAWRGDGAHDMAHWLTMRHGISDWKARRWIAAGHALEQLPRISEAFASGELGIDKVVELTRFATAETEGGLVTWAVGVSSGCIRHRADLELRRRIDEIADVERDRTLSWWYFDDGKRFALEAELPAAQGAVVARALDRLAREVPVMPGEAGPIHTSARRADALVGLCSGPGGAADPSERATVVVHASLEALQDRSSSCEIEGGPVIPTSAAHRLLCGGTMQVVIEDQTGEPIRLGRSTREPSAWMMRQLRYRDHECRFPGCGSRRFTQAHHVVWWRHGGRTDLDNLILLCFFHHRLVHEYGWRVRRGPDGSTRWWRSDGTAYRAGPGPPGVTRDPRLATFAASAR